MGTWNGHSKTRNRQRERFGQGKNNDKGIHEDLEWIRTCLWTRTGRRRKIIMGTGKGRATVQGTGQRKGKNMKKKRTGKGCRKGKVEDTVRINEDLEWTRMVRDKDRERMTKVIKQGYTVQQYGQGKESMRTRKGYEYGKEEDITL